MEAVLARVTALAGGSASDAGGGGARVVDPSLALSGGVRAANALPRKTVGGSFSWAAVAAADPTFPAAAAALQHRIGTLMSAVMNRVEAGAGGRAVAATGEVDPGEVYEFLDRLRESAETHVDLARGTHSSQQVAQVQRHLAAAAAAAVASTAAGGGGGGGGLRGGVADPPLRRMPLTSSAVKAKPQLAFEDAPIDNSRDTPFACKLAAKYHAWRPGPEPHASPSFTAEPWIAGHGVRHPYADEIAHLAFPPWLVAVPAALPPFRAVESTPCTLVDTPAKLTDMLHYLLGWRTLGSAEGAAALARSGSAGASALQAGWEDDGIRVPTPHRVTYDGAEGFVRPVAEVAIDLEAHSMRSYQGFTCLLQLSTRRADFLVDALALRSHMGALNVITAHPAIVKVLHGCDSDVVWLQRDFGVFLVNLFDTGQAARALNFPSAGLAHLLLKYAGVVANKQYQTADWRERPLPPALAKYAREDTHYLLEIYDRVRAELVAASEATVELAVAGRSTLQPVPALLAEVIQRSVCKALAVYDKEPWEGGKAARNLMRKLGLGDSSPAAGGDRPLAPAGDAGDGGGEEGDGEVEGSAAEQSQAAPAPPSSPRSRVFLALFDWRDRVARLDDESPHYVCPNRLLARLAQAQPSSVDALSRTCNPITPALRREATAVVSIIAEAKREPPLGGGAAAPASARTHATPVTAAAVAAAPTADSATHVGSKRPRPAAAQPPPQTDVAPSSNTAKRARKGQAVDGYEWASLLATADAKSAGARHVRLAAPQVDAKAAAVAARKVSSDSSSEDGLVSGLAAALAAAGRWSTPPVSAGSAAARVTAALTSQPWYAYTGVAHLFTIPTEPTTSAAAPSQPVAIPPEAAPPIRSLLETHAAPAPSSTSSLSLTNDTSARPQPPDKPSAAVAAAPAFDYTAAALAVLNSAAVAVPAVDASTSGGHRSAPGAHAARGGKSHRGKQHGKRGGGGAAGNNPYL